MARSCFEPVHFASIVTDAPMNQVGRVRVDLNEHGVSRCLGQRCALVRCPNGAAHNYKDFYALQELIDKGIGIFVANENRLYDQHSSSSDRFHFRVMGDVAQLEAEQIGERTSLGMTAKRQAGQITWERPIKGGKVNIVNLKERF